MVVSARIDVTALVLLIILTGVPIIAASAVAAADRLLGVL